MITQALKWLLLSSLILFQTSHNDARDEDRFDMVASFVAGSVRHGRVAPLKSFLTKSWKDHAHAMDVFWKKLDSRSLEPIRSWRSANFPGEAGSNTALYPLSGADFINLYAFFPDAHRYVMISLEAPGHLPDPDAHAERNLGHGLRSIERCVYSMAFMNFLSTQTQRVETSNDVFPGTLPVIMAFASRTGMRVTGVRNVILDASGRLQAAGGMKHRQGRSSASGFVISVQGPGAAGEREIIYLSLRIMPSSAGETTPEGKFIRSLGRLNLLIKSAVYLLHLECFRDFCHSLMNMSDIIVQDYSGIPFRYFRPVEWDIRLYGRYSGPAAFSTCPNPPLQNDLINAYRVVRPVLPFCFGYGALRGCEKSNLMLMVRKRR